MRRSLLLAWAVLLCLCAGANLRAADEVLTDKSSAEKVLALYRKTLAAAQKDPPAPGGVICLGSSHMQYWKTVQEDLAPLTVRNFGVGGSRMTQAEEYFIDHLAIAFRPRAVILYEGSNDINAGTEPAAVLASFRRLHGKLHAALPEARLYVLGVVPSPGKRFEKFAQLKEVNELLRAECATQPWMRFIDTTTPLLGADGKPKEDLFKPGDIHMLPAGYAVWKSVIAPVIVPLEKPFEKAK